MFFIYKNKGILVPIYLIAVVIGLAIVVNLLKSWVGGIFFVEYDMAIMFGIACVIAGEWTYRTRDSFYIANGQKKRMYEDNSFFFLSMEIWAYIYWSLGGICIVGGFLSLMGLA